MLVLLLLLISRLINRLGYPILKCSGLENLKSLSNYMQIKFFEVNYNKNKLFKSIKHIIIKYFLVNRVLRDCCGRIIEFHEEKYLKKKLVRENCKLLKRLKSYKFSSKPLFLKRYWGQQKKFEFLKETE